MLESKRTVRPKMSVYVCLYKKMKEEVEGRVGDIKERERERGNEREREKRRHI